MLKVAADVDKAPSDYAIGRYLLTTTPEIFDILAHRTCRGGEIQLTDAMIPTQDSTALGWLSVFIAGIGERQ